MSIDNSKFLFCFCTFVNDASHMEMVCAIVHQLTRNLTQEQIRSGGFSTYFINHTTGNFPCDANGMPFSAATLQVTGDPITDVHEDLAAEQKARTTYDNILRMTDDPDVLDAIRFLRAREVVHYQRFGEGLRIITDSLDDRNFYAFNPAFDTSVMKQTGAQQQQRTVPAQRQAVQKTAPAQQQAVQQSPLVTARTGKCTVEEATGIQGSFCGIPKNK